MLRAWAMLQHGDPGQGAVAASVLHSRPTGLTAWPPGAPGTPGTTSLLFWREPRFFCRGTVRLPITHLKNTAGPIQLWLYRCSGVSALTSPHCHTHQLETNAGAIRTGIFWAGDPCPVGASKGWQCR